MKVLLRRYLGILLKPQEWIDMVLRVHNAYFQEVWVAILYPTTACNPSRYAKQGWWRVVPNATITVLGGDLTSEAMYYIHAQAGDGTSWGTDTYDTCPNEGFNVCSNEFPNSPSFGFFEVYARKINKTVNLIGSGQTTPID
jgi:uncharacterized membrane protein